MGEEAIVPHFDLNAICDFITYSDNHKVKEVEMINTTIKGEEGEGQENSKTLRELIVPSNNQIDNIRYDLVKTFIQEVLNMGVLNEENGLTIGEQIAINTLKENKMLKL